MLRSLSKCFFRWLVLQARINQIGVLVIAHWFSDVNIPSCTTSFLFSFSLNGLPITTACHLVAWKKWDLQHSICEERSTAGDDWEVPRACLGGLLTTESVTELKMETWSWSCEKHFMVDMLTIWWRVIIMPLRRSTNSTSGTTLMWGTWRLARIFGVEIRQTWRPREVIYPAIALVGRRWTRGRAVAIAL